MQIFRFSKNQWENEWGMALPDRRSLHYTQQQKIDHTLTQVEGHQLWSVRSNVSIFRNIFYTLTSTSKLHNVNRHRRSHVLNGSTDDKPIARYGHAATRVPGGFVIFGGKSANSSFLNDLWLYYSNEHYSTWKELAKKSYLKPLPVARHTITYANNYLYVFGGSLRSGEFSSRLDF